jgi:anti-sigma-K factor RskA
MIITIVSVVVVLVVALALSFGRAMRPTPKLIKK